MEQACARRFGVKGQLCFLLAITAVLSGTTQISTAAEAPSAARAAANSDPTPPPPTAAATPIELAETADLPGVVIFPARASEPRPITVVLHGMCGDPFNTCSYFAAHVTETANLVCPRAGTRCTGGGASWPPSGVAQAVAAAVERAKAALPTPADDTQGRTLIGYSLGAYRALEIAQNSSGEYPRLMLIGARVSLDQKRLDHSGVQRILLSAGRSDMMHDPMQRETERALRSGIHAHFLDLGPVGHFFTPSFMSYLPAALSWLSEG
jgi:predicted esterase